MTDIEELVRRALAHRAGEAPAGTGITAAVRRGRARAAVAGGATAILVLAGGGTAVGLALHNERARPDTLVIASPGGDTAVRVVSFHGIELSVPASWTTNQAVCDIAERNTVVIDSAGETDQCGPGHQRPGISDVRLDVTSANDSVAAGHFTHAVARDGLTELIGTQPNPSGPHRTLVVLPAVHTTVTIDTDQTSLRQRILASIHAAKVSPEGCAMNAFAAGGQNRWFNQPATVEHPPLSQPLINTPASTITLCQYDADGGLSESAALDAGATAGVAEDLNQLTDNLRAIEQRSCLNALGSPAFVVIAHDAAGGTESVRVLDECGTYVLTNGARSGSLSTRQMSRFLDLLHDDDGSD